VCGNCGNQKPDQIEDGAAIEIQPIAGSQIETGDASVSLDLLIRSLIALGATRRELGELSRRSNLAKSGSTIHEGHEGHK